MALVRWPEGQQRSGSLGGSVYSRNRFGAYVRPRTVPVNPSTPAQAAIRNATLAAQAAWQSLSETARADWEDYAAAVAWRNRFGDSVNLTGQQHFLRVAITARYVGAAASWDTPPTTFRMPSPDETAGLTDLVVGTSGGKLSFGSATDAWKNVNGAALMLFVGRELPKTRGFYNGPWRFVLRVNGSASTTPTSPVSFTWPFGLFALAGDKVAAYVRTFIPGIGLSEPAKIFGTVGAAP